MTSSLPDEVRFWGIFAKLRTLGICDVEESDLYASAFADFYDHLVGDFASDIPILERLLRPGGRVLDLASGTGRISISLAQAGHEVLGLELSNHMLALASERTALEPPAVRARIACRQGDMTDFSLGERFDLIVVGITSISLLLTKEDRRSLFDCVRSHLAPGGRFVFDVVDLEEDRWRALDNFYDVTSTETDDGTDIAIVGQRFFPERGLFSFNVYRELIDWDGRTKRLLGNSVKAWLSRAQLTKELEEGGLRVIERLERDSVIYFVSEAADPESEATTDDGRYPGTPIA